MTEHALASVDEVLIELVEMVETARTVPMSSSCVIGRERALDLLDTLREVLPPELTEARRLIAQRDRVLADAAERAVEDVRSASERGEQLLAEAQAQAERILAAAQAEHQHLVATATVQQAAMAQAAQLTEQAIEHAEQVRQRAELAATKLTTEAEQYAGGTLTELVEHLKRLLATAENGRDALSRPAP